MTDAETLEEHWGEFASSLLYDRPPELLEVFKMTFFAGVKTGLHQMAKSKAALLADPRHFLAIDDQIDAYRTQVREGISFKTSRGDDR